MILYCHKRNIGLNKSLEICIEALGGITVAVEEIKPWLIDTLRVGDFLEKKVGIAVCSIEDRYNKKVGRELAKSRMKNTRLTVSRTLHEDDCVRVEFVSSNNETFTFVKYKSAKETFFVDYEKH
jgi:hypothetical protein